MFAAGLRRVHGPALRLQAVDRDRVVPVILKAKNDLSRRAARWRIAPRRNRPQPLFRNGVARKLEVALKEDTILDEHAKMGWVLQAPDRVSFREIERVMRFLHYRQRRPVVSH
jgi:hypothetical protein